MGRRHGETRAGIVRRRQGSSLQRGVLAHRQSSAGCGLRRTSRRFLCRAVGHRRRQRNWRGCRERPICPASVWTRTPAWSVLWRSRPTGNTWSPASATRMFWTPASSPNPLKVWEVATRRLIRRLSGHTGYCVSLDFSKDGARLASGSRDGTAIIWSTETWKATQTLQNPDTDSIQANGQWHGRGRGLFAGRQDPGPGQL